MVFSLEKVAYMKKCPHCRHTLNFLQFLIGYGSDTLFKHPAQAHPHEHRCLNCHYVIWIHYDRVFFKRHLKQSLLLFLAVSAMLTFVGVKPALHFSDINSVLFLLMVMVFGGLIIRAYVGYQSVRLKEEKA